MEETVEDLSEYHLRYLGLVLVKGKQDPLRIYECFDGNPPDILEKKRECQDLFRTGLEQYFAKDFTGAASTFQQILKMNPEDRAARLFLGKAAGFISNDVPEDWSGVERMGEK
jgi:two-component system sensor histidine kinase ChiS